MQTNDGSKAHCLTFWAFIRFAYFQRADAQLNNFPITARR